MCVRACDECCCTGTHREVPGALTFCRERQLFDGSELQSAPRTVSSLGNRLCEKQSACRWSGSSDTTPYRSRKTGLLYGQLIISWPLIGVSMADNMANISVRRGELIESGTFSFATCKQLYFSCGMPTGCASVHLNVGSNA